MASLGLHNQPTVMSALGYCFFLASLAACSDHHLALTRATLSLSSASISRQRLFVTSGGSGTAEALGEYLAGTGGGLAADEEAEAPPGTYST